jgi:rhodanese-related sulfurtransferase
VTIDQVLQRARSRLHRVTPEQAAAEMHTGAVLIDIRPEFQRRADGEIPGAIVVERVHLEWRCDPQSEARIPEAVDHDVRWLVCCDEGYSSSLAAASLQALGLHRATDVIDGFRGWRAAGLPVIRPAVPSLPRLPPVR